MEHFFAKKSNYVGRRRPCAILIYIRLFESDFLRKKKKKKNEEKEVPTTK